MIFGGFINIYSNKPFELSGTLNIGWKKIVVQIYRIGKLNLSALYTYAKIERGKKIPPLWYRALLTDLPQRFGAQSRYPRFKTTLICSIVEVLSTLVKFLGPFGLFTENKHAFQFSTRHSFGQFRSVIALHSISSQIRLCCTFICAAFKSRREWRKAKGVRASTTAIVLITAGTFNGLTFFGHMLYAPQFSM